MKVFVYEYCSCQPLQCDALTDALRQEGAAMLAAVTEDLRAVPGVEVLAFASTPDHERALFHELARAADYALIIAPETAGILEERCRWVVEAGGRLLGPAPDAVRLTADKLALAAHFTAHHIPTPVSTVHPLELSTFPVVCKPRFGAGAWRTVVVNTAAKVHRHLGGYPEEEFLVQPYHAGDAVSVALLIGPRVCVPLVPARQHLHEAYGELSYAGGALPLERPLCQRARELAQRAVATVPGLLGYVGVDLVLGETAADDVVIEINPRLTTSYLGLRRLCRDNLAAALLGVVAGRRCNLRWDLFQPVRWSSAGNVFSCSD